MSSPSLSEFDAIGTIENGSYIFGDEENATHLSGRGYALGHAEVAEEPREQQAERDPPVEGLGTLDVAADVQGLAVPEVFCGAALLRIEVTHKGIIFVFYTVTIT
ncbi:hypothetical protein TNCV_683031 [Trichonephila clavipes]|nr:hypothetical protein TNCV_683031 [Trichonephila clavipes]